jgi:hypothetical protein
LRKSYTGKEGLAFYHQGKLTDAEKRQLDNVKQQYILSKIKNFQISKQRAKEELITGLPHWESN